MRRATIVTLIAAGILMTWQARACQLPQVQTAFDTVAPTATDIIAVQVESLALTSEPDQTWQHTFRGSIRVVKHYRGSNRFTEITYTSNHCAGLRVNVGGIYLIATNSVGPVIELSSHAAPILHVSGVFTFDPELALRASDITQQLEAALRGDRTFSITTTEARQDLSTVTPPPRVPPPEELTP